MLNAIEIFSTAIEKFKNGDIIHAGYIEKNRDIIMRRIVHLSTGYYNIDSLDIRSKEMVVHHMLTELRKKIKETSKLSNVLIEDAGKILQDIQLDASKNLSKYNKKI